MTRKDFEMYVAEMAEDERKYATFLTHCSFALIGANWVLLQSAMKANTALVAGSLLSAVLYLFVRAMRHRLGLAHLREVLENHLEKTSFSAKDRSLSVNTPYSRFRNTLNHFELPLICTGASLFVAAAAVSILQNLI